MSEKESEQIEKSKTPWVDLPRYPLGHWPTPLQQLKKLSAELQGPNIWIKRDDCTGLALGGNKTRKLEFLIADALAKNCDTVITFGALQSNHARQTAAACAAAGLDCQQILTRSVASDHPSYESGGNLLLDNLLGATTHIVELQDAKDFSVELTADLEKQGKHPYLIPAGGSSPLGALGYGTCAEELAQQCVEHNINPGVLIHASSSAGTQAGLLVGLPAVDLHSRVMGINVYHEDPDRLRSNIKTLCTSMQASFEITGQPLPIEVNHAYFGEGYGIPTQECLDAIRTLARLEGILFDPVYSGKALAALIDQITLGNFDDYEDVVLLHTGGTPALWVYDHLLR
ncbi:MAG: D-cysteine desulfhydrase family protein [Pseudomonadaceae bacterium]|nr:D-cysteine desulfhydrase family protein [Pseudomonadaceae bacterium]